MCSSQSTTRQGISLPPVRAGPVSESDRAAHRPDALHARVIGASALRELNLTHSETVPT